MNRDGPIDGGIEGRSDLKQEIAETRDADGMSPQTTASPDTSAQTSPKKSQSVLKEVSDAIAMKDLPKEEEKPKTAEELALEAISAAGGKASFRVFRYAKGFDFAIIGFSTILNLAAGVVMPIFMSLFGDMMDTVGGRSGGHELMWYVKAQLICGAISFCLCASGACLMEITAERQMKIMKTDFLHSIMSQEMGWFDQFDSGRLSSTLQQNCVTIRDAIGLRFAQTMMFMGMFFGGYSVGFYRDWRMTLVVSATLPFIAAGSFAMFSAVGRADELARNAYARAGSIVEETLITIRSVMAFGLQQRQSNLFQESLADSYKAGIKSAFGVGGGLALMLGVVFLSYALGFWYGGKLVADSLEQYGIGCLTGEDDRCYSGGTAMAVFFCVLIGAFSLGQAGPNLSALGKAGAAMSAMHNITSRKSQIDPFSDAGYKVQAGEIKGAVTFENVSFTYPTRLDKQIYKDLNLSFEAGKSVALVGGSGCGKSTAIQLIERFYDVTSGHVKVDGRDVRDYNLRCLRRQVALVSQEPRLFASSIAENIRAGNLEADADAIRSAAKQANAHDFIMKFPDGYDTFVGEGGSQLSGGQKQRIAIARAILRNPSILILDEATSALDNESEKIVQQTLDKLLETTKRTTIIIAHRLTTIRTADKIVVLDNPDGMGSRTAEEGTHSELMALDGLYAALVNAQSLAVDENEENNEISADQMEQAEKERAALDLAQQFEQDLPRKASSIIRLRSKFSRIPSADRGDGRKQSREGSRLFKSKKKEPKVKGPGGFWKVIQNFAPYRMQVAIGLFGAALNGLVFPCFAIVFAKLVGAFYMPTAQEVRDEALFWALIFLGFSAGVAVANLLQHTSFGWAGHKVVQILRTRMFDSIVHQDMSFFDDPKHSTGTLSEMLSGDIVLLKGWVGDNLGIYLQNLSSLIAALIISFVASPKLAAVALGGFCVMAPAAMLESAFVTQGSNVVQDSDGAVVTEKDVETTGFLIQETIINIRTIGAYTLEGYFGNRYGTIIAKDYSKGVFRSYLAGAAWGLSQFLQFGVQALCLGYGGNLVENGEISPTDMMQAIFGLLMAAMGMGQTMIFATDGVKARAASHKIYSIIERVPSVDARNPAGQKITSLDKSISFQNVNFRYPQRPTVPIYKDINFDIKKGEVVALVGQSGCGKSTAIQLIERFYSLDPEQVNLPVGDGDGGAGAGDGSFDATHPLSYTNGGRIMIDSSSIGDINVKSLRSIMGLVSQEPVLFSGSIKDNIVCGKFDQVDRLTDQDVVDAAKSANAHTFVSEFPETYQTNVGKMGSQLSGGQKQRIAIARALIRDPQILILDEATSALDAESEKIVQAALDSVLIEKKRTTVVIAHRLSTVKKADKIVVLMNKGQGSYVAEVGTHEELLHIKDGVYSKLVKIAENK